MNSGRIFAIAVFVMAIPNAAFSYDLDSFEIAVQHFDPHHEVGIEYESREVEFVRQALLVARETVPEVRGIHVPTDGNGGTRWTPLMYRTIELRGGEQIWSHTTDTVDLMRRVGFAIGRDCRRVVRTDEAFTREERSNSETSIEWQLAGECTVDPSRHSCSNIEVVEWLCSLGVESILIKERASHRGRYDVNFYLVFATPVDLIYMSNRIANAPQFEGVFGKLVPTPYIGNLIGDGPSVEVVHREAGAGFSGICFKFAVGWGDCESGCIASHSWIIRCRAGRTGPDSNWHIEADLLDEGGNPLPEDLRAKLRSEEVSK